MPYIKAGEENSASIELYYQDHGSGKPIVLIHGWPLSSRSWEKQIPALLESGLRVITYDRRGFGLSSQPAIGYDYDTFAQDLDRLLSHLDLRDITLVGFSMGGGEVARYLSKFGAGRVSKAVFVAAVPPYLQKSQDNPEGVDPNIFIELKNIISKDRPAALSQFLLNFFNVEVFRRDRISEEALRLHWNIASFASPIATLACVGAFSQTDLRKDLTQIQIPTLIIHGSQDRICPLNVTGSRTHAAIKGSQLVVIEDAPHGLNWTHADRLNQELLAFATGTSTLRKAG